MSGQEWVPSPNFDDIFSQEKEDALEKEEMLVERIEALDVYDSERLNLILTWKGLLPTSNFIISANKVPRSEEELAKLCATTEQLFTDLGLKFKEKTDYPGRNQGVRFYQLAKSDAVMEEIIHTDFSDRKNAEQIGALYGIPHTAAHAYTLGPRFLIRDEDLPLKIRLQDYMALSKFWFSKDHWEEETDTLKKWAAEVKRIDPKLYERLAEQHKYYPFPLYKMGRVVTEDVPHVPRPR